MSKHTEDEIFQELYDGCSEQLSLIHPNYHASFMCPVLVRIAAKEREQKEFYKRMYNEQVNKSDSKYSRVA